MASPDFGCSTLSADGDKLAQQVAARYDKHGAGKPDPGAAKEWVDRMAPAAVNKMAADRQNEVAAINRAVVSGRGGARSDPKDTASSAAAVDPSPAAEAYVSFAADLRAGADLPSASAPAHPTASLQVDQGEQVYLAELGPKPAKPHVDILGLPEDMVLHRMSSALRAGIDYSRSQAKPNSPAQCCSKREEPEAACTGSQCLTNCCPKYGMSVMTVHKDTNHFYLAHLWLLKQLIAQHAKDNGVDDPQQMTEVEIRTLLARKPMTILPLCYLHQHGPPPNMCLIYSPDIFDVQHPLYRSHFLLQPTSLIPYTQLNATAFCLEPKSAWTRCPFLLRAAAELQDLKIDWQPPADDVVDDMCCMLESYTADLARDFLRGDPTLAADLFEALAYREMVYHQPDIFSAPSLPDSDHECSRLQLPERLASLLLDAFRRRCDCRLRRTRANIVSAVAQALRLPEEYVGDMPSAHQQAVLAIANVIAGDVRGGKAITIHGSLPLVPGESARFPGSSSRFDLTLFHRALAVMGEDDIRAFLDDHKCSSSGILTQALQSHLAQAKNPGPASMDVATSTFLRAFNPMNCPAMPTVSVRAGSVIMEIHNLAGKEVQPVAAALQDNDTSSVAVALLLALADDCLRQKLMASDIESERDRAAAGPLATQVLAAKTVSAEALLNFEPAELAATWPTLHHPTFVAVVNLGRATINSRLGQQLAYILIEALDLYRQFVWQCRSPYVLYFIDNRISFDLPEAYHRGRRERSVDAMTWTQHLARYWEEDCGGPLHIGNDDFFVGVDAQKAEAKVLFFVTWEREFMQKAVFEILDMLKRMGIGLNPTVATQEFAPAA